VRLAALVLPFALCPAVVAAQASTQHPAQQGTAAPSVAASQPSTSSERSEDRPGRLLVVDCPVHGTSDATSPSDADSTTQALVAALCARAGSAPASQATIRHLLTVPRDVSNAPRAEHELRAQ